MGHSGKTKLVTTLKDRCRMCYTCVRECPVKAIRIINGQAEIIDERCIGCGNCVKVCSQDAKVFLRHTSEVEALLKTGDKVAAILAPSFPSEFEEIKDYHKVIGMIRKLGFHYVVEVAFGADVIAKAYKKLLLKGDNKHYISSDCPGIVFYIEQYYPELVGNLAPIASPMVATTRIVRKKYGEDLKVVFIGPCIVKKAESNELNEVITFRELREMFNKHKINANNSEPSEFDEPIGGRGAKFPLSRGLLQNMNLNEDTYQGNIIVADGRIDFRDAIKEFKNDLDQSSHFELLCCEGCIMGPGMSPNGKRYARQLKLNNYVRKKNAKLNIEKWKKEVDSFAELDVSQHFMPNDRRIGSPGEEEIRAVLQDMGKFTYRDHLNCGACGYDTCIEHSIAIIQGLAETEMCLPFTIEKLHNYIKQLNISKEKLSSVRAALMQSEKLAHMGQLSAGIAHELNNPLGIITMYSNILLDECAEDSQLRKDLNLISEQANRCKNIVGGLLNFARKSQVNYTEINVISLINHCINSVIIPENVKINIITDLTDTNINVDKEQMTQVFTNLIKNAIEAMPEGGNITIRIEQKDNDFIFSVKDSGIGINKEHLDKNIFEPFFTTKKVGKGTGLGLALIYGIIKMHKGTITVESNADPAEGPTGTTFKITIPKKIIEITKIK
ncbi:MAG: 4Fe-4S binding protein [Bacteroidales bacterium]|nr:4Fe-4S binding protein [Bacteroidales bacterium]